LCNYTTAEALFPLFVAVLEGFSWNAFQLDGYAHLDIIKSTKVAPFQVVLSREIKLSTGTENRQMGGAEEPEECFFLPKIH
jgi:hypothetical protein